MFLYNIDKNMLEQVSEETGFVRDNLEKVYSPTDALRFINGNSYLKDRLVLKGRTAINFTVFELSGLSVDIDLDFAENCSRDVMFQERTEIDRILTRYMTALGYSKDFSRSCDVCPRTFVENSKQNI